MKYQTPFSTKNLEVTSSYYLQFIFLAILNFEFSIVNLLSRIQYCQFIVNNSVLSIYCQEFSIVNNSVVSIYFQEFSIVNLLWKFHFCQFIVNNSVLASEVLWHRNALAIQRGNAAAVIGFKTCGRSVFNMNWKKVLTISNVHQLAHSET